LLTVLAARENLAVASLVVERRLESPRTCPGSEERRRMRKRTQQL
jgi:hypothetical protein